MNRSALPFVLGAYARNAHADVEAARKIVRKTRGTSPSRCPCVHAGSGTAGAKPIEGRPRAAPEGQHAQWTLEPDGGHRRVERGNESGGPVGTPGGGDREANRQMRFRTLTKRGRSCSGWIRSRARGGSRSGPGWATVHLKSTPPRCFTARRRRCRCAPHP